MIQFGIGMRKREFANGDENRFDNLITNYRREPAISRP